MTNITVWINPNCSKCQRIQDILKQSNKVVKYRNYLEDPPSLEELRELSQILEVTDLHELVRSNEHFPDNESLLQALANNPEELLQRPIYITEKKALIARPPEVILE